MVSEFECGVVLSILAVKIGYFAIRVMVNYQVTKYHLQQFTDLEQVEEDSYWPESRYSA